MYSNPFRISVYNSPIITGPFQEYHPTYKLTQKLLHVYAGLSLLLLGMGIAFSVISLRWINVDLMYDMVFNDADLLALLALGLMFIATLLFSLSTLMRVRTLSPIREFSSSPLAHLNVALCFDQIAVIVVGAMFWWRSLRERAIFYQYWENGDDDFRNSLEKKFNCCGYYTTCQSSSTLSACVDAITEYADKRLCGIFTSVFASSAVVVLFYLCSLCMIAELRVLNRYRKIDIKQGRLSVV